jgi:hypothetical protein
VSDGLIKIFGGPDPKAIAVDPGAIDTAFATIRASRTVDLDGTSGPLDFDTATGTTPADIQVWCVDRSGPAPRFVSSGLSYSASLGTLVGTLTCF